ncbi:MAG: hypothetical protein A2Y07_07435 [Planctomycetes bacterium GWF2_50_10]|nr:MAG: hypothetical protein A2Y07_07435 [Planctomycetes bacterium GWF2_50_10]
MAVDPNMAMVCDPTTLYYVYSTTAQVLAAAFAFIGVFLLFRVEAINNAREKISEYLYNLPETKSKDMIQSYHQRNWVAFSNAYINHNINRSDNTNNKPPSEDLKSQRKTRLQEMILSPYLVLAFSKQSKEVIENFKNLSAWLISLIILSLIFLAISGLICHYVWSFWGPLILITYFSACSLWKCKNFIVTSLPVYKTDPDQEKPKAL